MPIIEMGTGPREIQPHVCSGLPDATLYPAGTVWVCECGARFVSKMWDRGYEGTRVSAIKPRWHRQTRIGRLFRWAARRFTQEPQP